MPSSASVAAGTVASLVLIAHAPLAALAIDNGLGLTPPMGWRSWNCYGNSISQQKMEAVMDAMASRVRTVNGKNMSLVDVGYDRVGLDDNWQACGKGAMGSFHDAQGNPLINLNTFPNMSDMTAHGRSLGLHVGWYMNNCDCGENQFTDKTTPTITQVMERSAAAVAAYGFEGVKLDGCSQFRNLTCVTDALLLRAPPATVHPRARVLCAPAWVPRRRRELSRARHSLALLALPLARWHAGSHFFR
jgi:hypothetical protein